MGTSIVLSEENTIVAPKSVIFTGLTSPKQDRQLLTANPASDWYVEVW
jgi:hypothetical protein